MKKKSKGMMDSPNSKYCYSGNPMAKPKEVESRFGPGGNPDQQKANKMLKQAHAQNESLRGKSGM